MFTFKKYENQMVFLQFFFFIFLKHNWHKLMRIADMPNGVRKQLADVIETRGSFVMRSKQKIHSQNGVIISVLKCNFHVRISSFYYKYSQ